MFYNQTQDTLNKIRWRHDIKLLIGDFNTQINGNREAYEQSIGQHVTQALEQAIIVYNFYKSAVLMDYVLKTYNSNTRTYIRKLGLYQMA